MEFKLNVLTRLMLLNNLPEQGSMDKIINKRNVRNKISFSSEEAVAMNLKTSEAGITWNPIDDLVADFTATEIKFLDDVMTEISNKDMMNEGLLDFALEIKDNLPKEEDKTEK